MAADFSTISAAEMTTAVVAQTTTISRTMTTSRMTIQISRTIKTRMVTMPTAALLEAADAEGGDDGDGGDDNDDDVNEEFSDPDDLIPLDEDTALSAADFPNATEADFQEDEGNWTPDDYQASAQNLFGDHEFFGDTMEQQRVDEGYQAIRRSRASCAGSIRSRLAVPKPCACSKAPEDWKLSASCPWR